MDTNVKDKDEGILGDGLAEQERKNLRNRQQQLDDILGDITQTTPSTSKTTTVKVDPVKKPEPIKKDPVKKKVIKKVEKVEKKVAPKDEEPPAWFKKFISEVSYEPKATKKEKNDITKEIASKMWNKGVKPRSYRAPEQSSSGGYERLYNQIFGR